MGFIWPFSSIESEDAKAIEDEEASGEVSCSGEWVIRASEEVLQDAYQATEPKE